MIPDCKSTQKEQDTQPVMSRSRLLFTVGILLGFLIGIGVGGCYIGYVMGMKVQRTNMIFDTTPPDFLSKPIELRINVAGPQTASNATPQPLVKLPSGSTTAGYIFTVLAETAGTALRNAESKVKDVSKLPTVAAEEFTKSLSGEAGKELVHAFSNLIASGFKPSADKNKDAQVLATMVVKEVIRDPSPSEGARLRLSGSPKLVEHTLFENNKASLTQSAYQAIQRIREFAVANPDSIILLSSNTDTTGTVARNTELAHQRTAAVCNSLVSGGGLSPNRIFSNDLASESLPIITRQNAPEPRNRSVTIEVR